MRAKRTAFVTRNFDKFENVKAARGNRSSEFIELVNRILRVSSNRALGIGSSYKGRMVDA